MLDKKPSIKAGYGQKTPLLRLLHVKIGGKMQKKEKKRHHKKKIINFARIACISLMKKHQ
jgi:hypothetical protein